MVNTYISIDLETTGLHTKEDKIIQIGAVKVVNGEVVEIFDTFVNPGRILKKEIIHLTGIHDGDLTNAPLLEKVMPELVEFAEDLPIVGHSVLFDYSFLKRAAVNHNLSFEKKGIDTLKIARKYLIGLDSRTLGNLCIHYGIEHQAHQALGDARATHFLYQKLCEEFYEEADFKPEDLYYAVKKESPVTKRQKEKLYELITRHSITVDYDVERLSRSEASRYLDKIFATYGR